MSTLAHKLAPNSVEAFVLAPGTLVPTRSSAPLPLALLEEVQKNQGNARATNTSRAYDSDWAAFDSWCAAHDQVSLPASGETVAAYLTDRASLVKTTGEYAYAPSSLSRWLTSINTKHQEAGQPQPGSLSAVKKTLAGIRRSHVRPTRRMSPLLLNDLKKVLAGIDVTSYPDGIIGQRDSAILVMGFAGAFRRSEIASRRIEDLALDSEQGMTVRLLTSKTDQEGRGSTKSLPFGANPLTCPPCATLRWLRVLEAASGPRPAMMKVLRASDTAVHICQGPALELRRADPKSALFRPVRRGGHVGVNAISGEVVRAIVKRRLSAVGMDPFHFGGHSLRAGFVTQALRAGASHRQIMRQTDHLLESTVEIYRREHDNLRDNAVTRVGL